MRDGCDSTADENEADVLKLKHSSCVRPLQHANFHPVHLERPNKENCFERLMKLHHVTCEGNCSPEKGEHTLSNQTPALLIWLMVTLRVLTGLQGAVHAIHFLINLWKYIRKAMWHRFTSPCMQNPELKFRSTNGCFRFFCFVLFYIVNSLILSYSYQLHYLWHFCLTCIARCGALQYHL